MLSHDFLSFDLGAFPVYFPRLRPSHDLSGSVPLTETSTSGGQGINFAPAQGQHVRARVTGEYQKSLGASACCAMRPKVPLFSDRRTEPCEEFSASRQHSRSTDRLLLCPDSKTVLMGHPPGRLLFMSDRFAVRPLREASLQKRRKAT